MKFRPWPHSLMGQMLLAVAAALLLVQGIGSVLVYQAQVARREMVILHEAAIRLLIAARGSDDAFRPRAVTRPLGHPGRGFRIERSETPPQREGEARDHEAETELRRILFAQSVVAQEVVIVRRGVGEDPAASERFRRRVAILGRDAKPPADERVLVAAIRPAGQDRWLVARVQIPGGERQIILSLLGQTLLIYGVLVAAIALILRRITRPLKALTLRLERFARTRDADSPLEPEGPDDVCRLIVAHNAMEARISDLLDEKDVMLGAIGHDLKTPLAALRVRIESVEDETERGRMAATIEDIVRTLDDILSLARVGRSSDPLERLELSALVASIVEEYEDMGEAVELVQSERIALPLRETWLRRALRNLIGNALRYGRRARVSVTREGEMAAVRIEDDGPGIPEGEISAMMEPFRRGDPSRNSVTGGAGIGLTLARAIADQHGGSLELANRRDVDGAIVGLAATLRLPL